MSYDNVLDEVLWSFNMRQKKFKSPSAT